MIFQHVSRASKLAPLSCMVGRRYYCPEVVDVFYCETGLNCLVEGGAWCSNKNQCKFRKLLVGLQNGTFNLDKRIWLSQLVETSSC